MANVDLSRWDQLSKWTQKYYRRSMRVQFTQNEDKTFHVAVDYGGAWGVAEGTGKSKAEAKAVAAEDAWTQIYNGDFIGDNDDIDVYNDFTGENVPYAEY